MTPGLGYKASVSERQTTAGPSSSLVEKLLRVAWLSIMLGLVMEALILLLTAGFGELPGIGVIAAELAQQVSWAFLVCVALSLGNAAANLRRPALMGFLGLLAAPLSFIIARSLHDGLRKALGVVGTASIGFSIILVVVVLKGVEYGCLGAAIGWVGQRPWGGLGAHIAVGLGVGIVFGGLILAVTYWGASSPLSTANLISRGVNEILFPTGCSLVLFSADALGQEGGD
ncbi:MAG: hypothetical protein QOI57_2905 [Rubrobacteraceae bacterium]|nr:hypothetical protein [Rubrobacteraceae bacterium]